MRALQTSTVYRDAKTTTVCCKLERAQEFRVMRKSDKTVEKSGRQTEVIEKQINIFNNNNLGKKR